MFGRTGITEEGFMATRKQTAPAPQTTVLAPPSRGSVDAPGKRHRKPLPAEPLDKRMGERRGKHMGQKSVKNSLRAR